MNFKKSLKDVLVLFIICVVFAAALAGTNMLTKDAIAEKKAAAETGAYAAVMPDAKGFETVNIEAEGVSSTVVEIKKETSGLGYVVKLQTNGYKPGMVILVAINPEGVITAATCIESNETWGLEAEMSELIVGKDASTIVDVKAGVTSMTVNGYRGAVRDALNALIILGLTDGELDDRTPEQILFDNLKAALPGAFTEETAKYEDAFTEDTIIAVSNSGDIILPADLSINAVHKAINGAGYVYVVEKEFIAVDAEGNILTADATDAAKAAVSSALETKASAVANEIEITEFKDSSDRATKTAFKYINSVKKTEDGVYVVELSVKGYSSAPTPMEIIVTVGVDGTIVEFAVTSHSETSSEPYGGAKIESGYYDEYFIGKNATECKDVDFNTIKNGATETSKGIQKAMNYSFVAVTAIENAEGGATNE